MLQTAHRLASSLALLLEPLGALIYVRIFAILHMMLRMCRFVADEDLPTKIRGRSFSDKNLLRIFGDTQICEYESLRDKILRI